MIVVAVLMLLVVQPNNTDLKRGDLAAVVVRRTEVWDNLTLLTKPGCICPCFISCLLCPLLYYPCLAFGLCCPNKCAIGPACFCGCKCCNHEREDQGLNYNPEFWWSADSRV